MLANVIKTVEPEELIIYSVTDGVNSKATKTNYRKGFSHFLKHYNLNERTLLAQATQYSPRRIETMMIEYIKHLAEDQNLCHGSIHSYCFAIFHFFEMNDVLLNKRKIMRFLPANEGSREDRVYT